MTPEEQLTSVLATLRKRFRAAGHGSIKRAQEALGLGVSYFRDQRNGKLRVDLVVLLKALDFLGRDPTVFFLEALGQGDPLADLQGETAALPGPAPPIGAKVRRRLQRAKPAGERHLGADYLERLDSLRYTDARLARSQALAAVDRVEPGLLPRLLGVYASALRMLGELRGAQKALALGLELADAGGDRAAVAELWQRFAYVVGEYGSYARALLISERAMSLFAKAGDFEGVAKTLVDQGKWLLYLGRHRSSCDLLQAALRCLPASLLRSKAAAFQLLGLNHLEVGELDAASTCAEAAKREAVRSNEPWLTSGVLWLEVKIALRQDDFVKAAGCFREAIGTFLPISPLETSLEAIDLLRVLAFEGFEAEMLVTAQALVPLVRALSGNPEAQSVVAELVRGGMEGGSFSAGFLASKKAELEHSRTHREWCARRQVAPEKLQSSACSARRGPSAESHRSSVRFDDRAVRDRAATRSDDWAVRRRVTTRTDGRTVRGRATARLDERAVQHAACSGGRVAKSGHTFSFAGETVGGGIAASFPNRDKASPATSRLSAGGLLAVRTSLLEALRCRFDAAGRGALRRAQVEADVGGTYFNDLCRRNSPVFLDVLLKFLASLSCNPAEFFVEVLGPGDTVTDQVRAAAPCRDSALMEKVRRRLASPPAAQGTASHGSEYLETLDCLRYIDARAARAQALTAVGLVQIELLPRLLGVYGSTLRSLNRLRGAEKAISYGLQLAREAGDIEAVAELWQRLAHVPAHRSEYRFALTLSHRAMRIYARNGDFPSMAKALVDQGIWLFYQGEHRESIQLAKTALQHLPSFEAFRRSHVTGHQLLGLNYLELAAFDRAKSAARKAREAAEGAEPWVVSGVLWLEAKVALAEEDYSTAEAALRQAVDVFLPVSPLDAGLASVELLRALLLQGRAADAHAEAKAMARLVEPLGDNPVAEAALVELVCCGLESHGLSEKLLDRLSGKLESGRCRREKRRRR